jgi:hypothetical protein
MRHIGVYIIRLLGVRCPQEKSEVAMFVLLVVLPGVVALVAGAVFAVSEMR